METNHIPESAILALAIPSFLFGIYYCYRATRMHRLFFLGFIAIIFYAYYLETTDIRTMHSYYYREVFVMLGSEPLWVPLSICVSWASLITIAMLTTNKLAVPWWQRPWIDGLIAVSVDFVSDPVMSSSVDVAKMNDFCFGSNGSEYGGMGFWVWCVPEDSAQWLNVPLGNFIGWYMVVVVISYVFRSVINLFPEVEKLGLGKQILAVAGGTAVAFVALMAALQGYRRLVLIGMPEGLIAAALFGWGLGTLFRTRKRMERGHKIDWGLIIMPALSWVGSLTTLFLIGGIDLPMITTFLYMLIAACVSALLLFLPYTGAKAKPGPPEESAQGA